jgi:hypothetical protein
VWETDAGRLVKQFSGKNPKALVFSPDRGRLAITRPGGAYEVLSTEAWTEVAKGGAPDNVQRVFFSPDGEMVLETSSGLHLSSEKTDAPETNECRSANLCDRRSDGGVPERLRAFRVVNGCSRGSRA